MYQIIAYIKFICYSTNQHGVHSPFIYNFITKCLYNKVKLKDYNKFNLNKKQKLLYKVINYFNCNTILNLNTTTEINPILIKQVNDSEEYIYTEDISAVKNKTFNFIFINNSAKIKTIELLFNCIHNDSILVLDTIYKSKKNTGIWEYIKHHKSVIVTVDCYYLGFVFFRKEQAKEHFKVRV